MNRQPRVRRRRALAQRHNLIMRTVVRLVLAGVREVEDDAFGLVVLESAAAALIAELVPPSEQLGYVDRLGEAIKARIVQAYVEGVIPIGHC